MEPNAPENNQPISQKTIEVLKESISPTLAANVLELGLKTGAISLDTLLELVKEVCSDARKATLNLELEAEIAGNQNLQKIQALIQNGADVNVAASLDYDELIAHGGLFRHLRSVEAITLFLENGLNPAQTYGEGWSQTLAYGLIEHLAGQDALTGSATRRSPDIMTLKAALGLPLPWKQLLTHSNQEDGDLTFGLSQELIHCIESAGYPNLAEALKPYSVKD